MAGDQPIIIKKVKKGGGHGHHGGAWKVAYADFVTAMMAFFLLMWLINTTTPEQRRGIADYFAPASVSPSTSGNGGVLGGTALGEDGAQGRGSSSVIERLAPDARRDNNTQENESPDASDGPQASTDAMASAMARREQAEFDAAEQSLRQAMQDMPEIAELSRQLLIDQTPEGLRIQLVDQEGRAMFRPGSAEPNERAVVLLRAVAEIAQQLPNRLSISGHTDSGPSPAPDYTNWDLSADRANAARRILQSSGLADDRIAEVQGRAGTEPLYPDDPYLPGNRRLSIVLLREAPVLPSGGL
ncbi:MULTISPECIES: flagellar motor protein MotB [Hyphobacterium]|uniref:Flagellar motor protein MotB n=1 Tax=Hyphobacterium vulgare TaxID=1736751 RepID=A0ABV6ZTF2_9PROT